jgi:hypothetical protein
MKKDRFFAIVRLRLRIQCRNAGAHVADCRFVTLPSALFVPDCPTVIPLPNPVMPNSLVAKRLPHITLGLALAVAGLLLLQRPAGRPVDSPGVPLVDPRLAQPWPVEIQLRPVVRERLAREVIDRRRSLLSAAALFRQLNQLDGRPADRWLLQLVDGEFRLPGNTPAARLCRQVEAWVRVALREDVPRRDAGLARLEAEFRDAPRRDGDLRLPDAATLEPVEELIAHARDHLAE